MKAKRPILSELALGEVAAKGHHSHHVLQPVVQAKAKCPELGFWGVHKASLRAWVTAALFKHVYVSSRCRLILLDSVSPEGADLMGLLPI